MDDYTLKQMFGILDGESIVEGARRIRMERKALYSAVHDFRKERDLSHSIASNQRDVIEHLSSQINSIKNKLSEIKENISRFQLI
jgi:hypothetical protein